MKKETAGSHPRKATSCDCGSVPGYTMVTIVRFVVSAERSFPMLFFRPDPIKPASPRAFLVARVLALAAAWGAALVAALLPIPSAQAQTPDLPVTKWVRQDGTDDIYPVAYYSHITVDKNGAAYAVAAGYARVSDVFMQGKSVWILVKYNAEGALLWRTTYGGAGATGNVPAALAVDKNNNVIVTGTVEGGWDGGGGRKLDAATVKFSAATGAVLWQNKVDGRHADDRGVGIALDAAGNAYMVATSYDFTAVGSSNDIAVVKMEANTGAVTVATSYNAGYGDDASAIAVTGNGQGIYVTGTTYNNVTANKDIVTVKFDANGAVLWSPKYDYADYDDKAVSVSVDPATGDAFVAGGGGFNANSDGNYVALRYASANGALVWAGAYAGGQDSNSVPVGAALDPVTGGFYLGGNLKATNDVADSSDTLTVRFDIATGAATWAKTENYSVAANSATTVIADGLGNLYVGGSGMAPNGHTVSLLYRYEALTGARLWTVSRGAATTDAPTFAESIAINPLTRELYVGGLSSDNPSNPATAILLTVVKYSQPTTLRPVGLAASGGDGKTRLLWRASDNRSVTLWTMNAASGAIESGKAFDLPPGYAPVKFTVAQSDNKPRLLLVRTRDNQAVIWTFSANSLTLESGRTFVATGYKPVDLAVSPTDNKIRLVWSNLADNRAALWTLNAAGAAVETGYLFNPPADPSTFIASLCIGADSRIRLLWRTPGTPGKGYLYTLNAAGSAASNRLTLSLAGYKPALLASPMGADSKPRIIWTGDTDGRIRLTTYNAAGLALDGAVYNYGPYTGGAFITGVSVNRADNKPYLLWGYPTGSAAVWRVNGQTGAIERGTTYGPYKN